MKEQILELRAQGKTYDEIAEIVGCSKGTVWYHCTDNGKEKAKERKRRNRLEKPLSKKITNFRYKVANFKRTSPETDKEVLISYEDVFNKISENPYCYLTGRSLNILDTKSYHFDHIIPASKGGKGTLENLGITCKEANQAKSDLSVEDFLLLCEEVLKHNGYEVNKKQ